MKAYLGLGLKTWLRGWVRGGFARSLLVSLRSTDDQLGGHWGRADDRFLGYPGSNPAVN